MREAVEERTGTRRASDISAVMWRSFCQGFRGYGPRAFGFNYRFDQGCDPGISSFAGGGMLLVAGCLAVSADSVERMMGTRVPRDDTAIRCRYEFVLI